MFSPVTPFESAPQTSNVSATYLAQASVIPRSRHHQDGRRAAPPRWLPRLRPEGCGRAAGSQWARAPVRGQWEGNAGQKPRDVARGSFATCRPPRRGALPRTRGTGAAGGPGSSCWVGGRGAPRPLPAPASFGPSPSPPTAPDRGPSPPHLDPLPSPADFDPHPSPPTLTPGPSPAHPRLPACPRLTPTPARPPLIPVPGLSPPHPRPSRLTPPALLLPHAHPELSPPGSPLSTLSNEWPRGVFPEGRELRFTAPRPQ